MTVMENGTRLAVHAVLAEIVALVVKPGERAAFAARCQERLRSSGAENEAVIEIAGRFISRVVEG